MDGLGKSDGGVGNFSSSATSPESRRKFTRSDLEQFAQQAAFVINMAGHAKQEVPLDDGEIEKNWVTAWMRCDQSVMLEVQMHLSQDASLEPRGVKQLAELNLGCVKSATVRVEA